MNILSICAVALTALATAQDTCRTVNSIQYCNAVDSIKYTDIKGAGTYEDVNSMDAGSCSCKTQPKSYDGVLSPLDEQLSLHFRGPLSLKKFAVYYPTQSGKAKRKDKKGKRVGKRVAHFGKHHHRRHTHAERSELEYFTDEKAGFKRTAFYDAEAGLSDGLVFMNHRGGEGSGVFDHCWGNSISYAKGNCDGGAKEPEILADITIPSNNEFIIFSDEKCDGDCGYYRPGIPAYRGFGGKSKVFVFQFQMPKDTEYKGFNENKPAIWALNAKIPRTAQYGSCSCWDTGCGEMDLFEVLEDAEDYVKSHYHSAQGAVNGRKGGGGSRDYFDRPYNKPVKAAAIFDEDGSVTVRLLPDSIEFGKLLDPTTLVGAAVKASTYNVPV